jgi:hypothetical protein
MPKAKTLVYNCWNCGEELPLGTLHCPECHVDVDENATEEDRVVARATARRDAI